MDLNESFINGLISSLKSKLLKQDELNSINKATSFHELLKVLNRTIYVNVSANIKINDYMNAELLFLNHLFELINKLKLFSSIRIKKLLNILYPFWFGYYNSVADLKNVEPLFKSFNNSIEPSINMKQDFKIKIELLINNLTGLFNEDEIKIIKEFINYRFNNSFIINNLKINFINELINFLYKKEEELGFILKKIRSLSW